MNVLVRSFPDRSLAILQSSALMCIAVLFALLPVAALAAEPSPHLEDATITGSGPTITATRVPVSTQKGIVYRDVTITLEADSDGSLSLAHRITDTPSPSLITAGFRAGRYEMHAPGQKPIAVRLDGPGVGLGGSTVWTLSPDGDGCPYGAPSSWTVGAGNPVSQRVDQAKISSPAMSFGTLGTVSCQLPSQWATNALIGVQQVGSALVLTSFSDGTDKAAPTGSITYRLVSGG